MQWVCYLEVHGLYAAAAHEVGLVAENRPVAVIREGAVFDGCRSAYTAGLVLGAPARQVLRDVPQAVQVELAEIQAEPRARRWWERCLAHTPYIEPDGLHRLFLALPCPGAELTGALREEVRQLREAAAEAGFTAFAGVAANRTVARAAALSSRDGWLCRRPGTAGTGAPRTVAFVPPGQEERFLADLPIEYLPVPAALQRRLARLGMRSIGDLARIADVEWVRQIGPVGRQVSLWSRGIDQESVRPCYPPRTRSRRVQFQPEVRGRDALESALVRAAASLSRSLSAAGEGCQQVALNLEAAGAAPLRAVRTLARLQQEAYPIQQAVSGLLEELVRQGLAVTAAEVELRLIGPMPLQQMDLWEDQARREREQRIERALALLHERFPVRVVGLGQGAAPSWREQMLLFNDPYRADPYRARRPAAQ